MYLIQNFCFNSQYWRRGEDGKWIGQTGRPIKFSDYFDDINRKIDELARFGVSVAWYYVRKNFVAKAGALALAALS